MLVGDSKWGAFYGCDAFILPSHQENFGIAVAEALACGKPVLISNKVNIFREIEKGAGGFIDEDNLNGTFSNLSKWFSLSLDLKKKMGDSAYQVYQEHFSSENSTIHFLDKISNN
jgi:glycosyltransferase involved in cell wall biosynthesis